MQQDPNYGKHEDEESRLRRVSIDKEDQSGGTGSEGQFGGDTTGGEPSGGGFGSAGGSMGTVGMSSMSASDERMWSMLAHLSTLLNLITGIGGPVAAFVIWLVYKDRSPRVGFHALQSLWYQVAWIVILAIGWTVTGVLTIIFIGLLLIPVMLVLSVVPFVWQCYAAYKVNQGFDYRYPFIADMVDPNHRFG